MHFLEIKCSSIQISVNVVSKGLTDKKSTKVQVMTWCRTGHHPRNYVGRDQLRHKGLTNVTSLISTLFSILTRVKGIFPENRGLPVMMSTLSSPVAPEAVVITAYDDTASHDSSRSLTVSTIIRLTERMAVNIFPNISHSHHNLNIC